MKFCEILPTLETIDHVARIELFDDGGDPAGVIENKPGSQGSVRVYHHLWKKCGSISCDAARQGLQLYAEHTEDAQHYPGKHPNIDRLFYIVENAKPLSVKIVEI